MKKAAITLSILIVLIAIPYLYPSFKKNGQILISTSTTSLIQNELKNATFEIDGKKVILKYGISEESIVPSSTSKIITRYFGNESIGDLNFDNIPDVGFLITQEQGGSGTFFYAVAAIKTSSGYKYTNAFFIGDRIAPQNTQIVADELYVNYAERKSGEPMSTPPSQGVTKLLKVTPEGVLEGLMK